MIQIRNSDLWEIDFPSQFRCWANNYDLWENFEFRKKIDAVSKIWIIIKRLLRNWNYGDPKSKFLNTNRNYLLNIQHFVKYRTFCNRTFVRYRFFCEKSKFWSNTNFVRNRFFLNREMVRNLNLSGNSYINFYVLY